MKKKLAFFLIGLSFVLLPVRAMEEEGKEEKTKELSRVDVRDLFRIINSDDWKTLKKFSDSSGIAGYSLGLIQCAAFEKEFSSPDKTSHITNYLENMKQSFRNDVERWNKRIRKNVQKIKVLQLFHSTLIEDLKTAMLRANPSEAFTFNVEIECNASKMVELETARDAWMKQREQVIEIMDVAERVENQFKSALHLE